MEVEIEIEIEEGSSSLSLPVGIRHSLHSTTCGCWLHSTNLRLLLEEEDEDSLEFLRMNHFPSVYVRFRFSTYPVIHYFSMLVST